MKEVRSLEDDINDQLFAAENDAAGTVSGHWLNACRCLLCCRVDIGWNMRACQETFGCLCTGVVTLGILPGANVVSTWPWIPAFFVACPSFTLNHL
jgi:hypothetical protein